MFVCNLSEQIQEIIDYFCKGSQADFAKRTGISTSTLQKNLAAKRGDLLGKHAEAILKAFPSVREVWLYTGEGEMVGLPRSNGVRGAMNTKGKAVGDLINIALQHKNISIDQIVTKTDIPKSEMEAILESSRLPNFAILEALYKEFGLNPAYMFHGDERLMFESRTALDHIAFLLGYYRDISDDVLQDWFGCSEDEAVNYLADYKRGRNNIREHGLDYCVKNEMATEPVLPSKWHRYFTKYARLVQLPDGGRLTPPLVHTDDKLKEHKNNYQQTTQDAGTASAQHGNIITPERQAFLEREIVHLQELLLASKDEIIDLQKRLLQQAHPQHPQAAAEGLSALTSDNVAP